MRAAIARHHDEMLRRIETVECEVALGDIGIGRERRFLDQELGAPAFGLEKCREQLVQVRAC